MGDWETWSEASLRLNQQKALDAESLHPSLKPVRDFGETSPEMKLVFLDAEVGNASVGYLPLGAENGKLNENGTSFTDVGGSDTIVTVNDEGASSKDHNASTSDVIVPVSDEGASSTAPLSPQGVSTVSQGGQLQSPSASDLAAMFMQGLHASDTADPWRGVAEEAPCFLNTDQCSPDGGMGAGLPKMETPLFLNPPPPPPPPPELSLSESYSSVGAMREISCQSFSGPQQSPRRTPLGAVDGNTLTSKSASTKCDGSGQEGTGGEHTTMTPNSLGAALFPVTSLEELMSSPASEDLAAMGSDFKMMPARESDEATHKETRRAVSSPDVLCASLRPPPPPPLLLPLWTPPETNMTPSKPAEHSLSSFVVSPPPGSCGLGVGLFGGSSRASSPVEKLGQGSGQGSEEDGDEEHDRTDIASLGEEDSFCVPAAEDPSRRSVADVDESQASQTMPETTASCSQQACQQSLATCILQQAPSAPYAGSEQHVSVRETDEKQDVGAKEIEEEAGGLTPVLSPATASSSSSSSSSAAAAAAAAAAWPSQLLVLGLQEARAADEEEELCSSPKLVGGAASPSSACGGDSECGSMSLSDRTNIFGSPVPVRHRTTNTAIASPGLGTPRHDPVGDADDASEGGRRPVGTFPFEFHAAEPTTTTAKPTTTTDEPTTTDGGSIEQATDHHATEEVKGYEMLQHASAEEHQQQERHHEQLALLAARADRAEEETRLLKAQMEAMVAALAGGADKQQQQQQEEEGSLRDDDSVAGVGQAVEGGVASDSKVDMINESGNDGSSRRSVGPIEGSSSNKADSSQHPSSPSSSMLSSRSRKSAIADLVRSVIQNSDLSSSSSPSRTTSSTATKVLSIDQTATAAAVGAGPIVDQSGQERDRLVTADELEEKQFWGVSHLESLNGPSGDFAGGDVDEEDIRAEDELQENCKKGPMESSPTKRPDDLSSNNSRLDGDSESRGALEMATPKGEEEKSAVATTAVRRVVAAEASGRGHTTVARELMSLEHNKHSSKRKKRQQKQQQQQQQQQHEERPKKGSEKGPGSTRQAREDSLRQRDDQRDESTTPSSHQANSMLTKPMSPSIMSPPMSHHLLHMDQQQQRPSEGCKGGEPGPPPSRPLFSGERTEPSITSELNETVDENLSPKFESSVSPAPAFLSASKEATKAAAGGGTTAKKRVIATSQPRIRLACGAGDSTKKVLQLTNSIKNASRAPHHRVSSVGSSLRMDATMTTAAVSVSKKGQTRKLSSKEKELCPVFSISFSALSPAVSSASSSALLQQHHVVLGAGASGTLTVLFRPPELLSEEDDREEEEEETESGGDEVKYVATLTITRQQCDDTSGKRNKDQQSVLKSQIEITGTVVSPPRLALSSRQPLTFFFLEPSSSRQSQLLPQQCVEIRNQSLLRACFVEAEVLGGGNTFFAATSQRDAASAAAAAVAAEADAAASVDDLTVVVVDRSDDAGSDGENHVTRRVERVAIRAPTTKKKTVRVTVAPGAHTCLWIAVNSPKSSTPSVMPSESAVLLLRATSIIAPSSASEASVSTSAPSSSASRAYSLPLHLRTPPTPTRGESSVLLPPAMLSTSSTVVSSSALTVYEDRSTVVPSQMDNQTSSKAEAAAETGDMAQREVGLLRDDDVQKMARSRKTGSRSKQSRRATEPISLAVEPRRLELVSQSAADESTDVLEGWMSICLCRPRHHHLTTEEGKQEAAAAVSHSSASFNLHCPHPSVTLEPSQGHLASPSSSLSESEVVWVKVCVSSDAAKWLRRTVVDIEVSGGVAKKSVPLLVRELPTTTLSAASRPVCPPRTIHQPGHKRKESVFFKGCGAIINFGCVPVGTLSTIKVKLCNAGEVIDGKYRDGSVEVMVHHPGSPFVLLHHRIVIQDRTFVNLPVRFLPTTRGSFETTLPVFMDCHPVCEVTLVGNAT